MFGSAGQAVLRYDAADFDVLQRGTYVLCAVSGERIALEELKYWSIEFQEAYRGADEATAAALAGGGKNVKR